MVSMLAVQPEVLDKAEDGSFLKPPCAWRLTELRDVVLPHLVDGHR